MFLALTEMRRAKVRFGLLIAAVGLLVFMILFQQSLQNGLLRAFVGAIRNQSAPVLVYAVDGQRVIQGSAITADLEQLVRRTTVVGAVGRIGESSFTVDTAAGQFDATIFGYERPDLGAPRRISEGRLPVDGREALSSSVDVANGLAIGDTVTVQPGGLELVVVGLADDVQLNGDPTLFVTYPTFLAAVRAGNPDAREPPPNVLGVAPVAGVSDTQLAAAINAQSDDLDALTRSRAADLTPGVSQIRRSFQVIFLLFALVVPCVTGLFFLIVTFQKSAALTLLRAIGAPAARLVRSLLVQAALVLAAGYAIGLAIYAPVSQQRIGSIALRFETRSVVVWVVLLTLLGVGSSLVAARRVFAIDPIEATVGSGVR